LHSDSEIPPPVRGHPTVPRIGSILRPDQEALGDRLIRNVVIDPLPVARQQRGRSPTDCG
jgi:hypothetical protein